MPNRFAIATALLLLAACGGGGADNAPMVPTEPPTGGTPQPTPPGTPQPTPPDTPPSAAPTRNALEARIAEANRVRSALSRFAPTSTESVPTSGASTFAGPAVMTVKQGTRSYSMVGDSRMRVNFDSRQISGNITNVEGRRENQSTFAATGQIDYSNGRLVQGRNSNVFTVDYAGNLKAGSDNIALDGRAIGGFYGNRSTQPLAIQALDGTPGTDAGKATGLPGMTAKVNGANAAGQIYIGGTRN